MSDVVIAANTSIKHGSSNTFFSGVVGGNGDTGRLTWHSSPANGTTNFNVAPGSYLESAVPNASPANLIPYVRFSVAGGGSNNRESFTQVWINYSLVYSVQQTGGASTGFTLFLPTVSGFSLPANTLIEYRLQSFKDVGGANARTISTGYYDPITGASFAALIVAQQFINSP